MNVRNRLTKLEDKSGIHHISVAESLMDLKRRKQAGEHIPSHTPEELKKLIAECQNEELRELYRALLRAKQCA